MGSDLCLRDISYSVQGFFKVAKILQTEGDSEQVTGSFTIGETLTGSLSGLTATLSAYEATTAALYMEVADVAAGATTVHVSRNTGLADGARLMIAIDSVSATEIIEIDPTGINGANNTLTVTRGVLGTTASAIPAGSFAKSYNSSLFVCTCLYLFVLLIYFTIFVIYVTVIIQFFFL